MPLRRRAAALAAILVTLASATPAVAAGPRLVIDQAEAEPSWFPGLARLRLHVTAVVLEGATIPLGAGDDLVLSLGGSRRRESALIGRSTGRGDALAIALVVEVGWAYASELATVSEALRTLAEGLPDEARVTVVTYGESVEGGHRFESPAQAARRLIALDSDTAPADADLLKAIDRAVLGLSKLEPTAGAPPLRRVVVVLSDGIDQDPTPERYRAAGERAAKRAIRIHSLAFSPVDNRRPLIGLGELSKRSGGTFRWVRSREGFPPQIETLLDELGRQYVLTYFLPPADLIDRRIALTFKALGSNEIKVDRVACGDKTCAEDEFCAERACLPRGRSSGGILRWLLWLVGGGLAFLVVGGLISAIVQRRGAPRIVPPPRVRPSGAAPVHAPAVPDHRLAPVMAGGARAPAAGPAVPGNARPATLTVTSGPLSGHTLALRHGFMIGNAQGCDLSLRDPHASAQHAQFIVDTMGNYTLVDRGSINGTFVNGVRVRDVRLNHGVAIKIGTTELRFLLG